MLYYRRTEVIQDLDHVVKAFERVQINNKATKETYNTEQLVGFVETKITEVQSILIILNTKMMVKELYENLNKDSHISIYHLSTAMCPAHRIETLDEIRRHLKAKNKIICIST